ncbi:MAG: glutamate racemase [Thermodesulfovibrionales bacterium]|nr:glutamate racemase [Thermodesulfovibrionales bacterium]
MNNSPIGIFDSGIGGLTVLKAVLRELPAEGTVYLGDTARVPYGIRSMETVIRYSFESMRFLLKKDIKMLVIACNTASAISLEAIRNQSPIPVIGVIGPGAKAAVEASKNRRIGVIGTEATIRSRSYIKAIKTMDNRAGVFGLPCPLFVPLVEEGWMDGEIATLTAQKYLGGLRDKKIDTLLLGCTHYPLLKSTISKVMGPEVTLIDSAVETAKEIKATLRERRIAAGTRKGRKPVRQFYVTDSPERFKLVGERFLGQEIKNIEMVRLDTEAI